MKTKGPRPLSSIILTSNTIIIFVAVFSFSIISLGFNLFSTIKMSNKSLHNAVFSEARKVELHIGSLQDAARSFGTIPILSDPSVPSRVKQNLLDLRAKNVSAHNIMIINLDGYSDSDLSFHKDTEYFNDALLGKTTISNPMISRVNGELCFVIAAPIWQNGVINSEISGVLIFEVGFNFLLQDITTGGFSRNTISRIISESGDTVADPDLLDILEGFNYQTEAKSNPKFNKLANIEKNILSNGFDSQHIFKFFRTQFFFSAPIKNSPGWYYIICTPLYDYLNLFVLSTLLFSLIGLILVLVCRRETKKFAAGLSDPVKNMAERLRRAAVGDFTSTVSSEEEIVEVKTISEATQALVNRMALVINASELAAEKTDYFSFLNVPDFEKILDFLKSSFNVNLTLLSKDGLVLFGSESQDHSKDFSSNILIKNKAIGRFIISPTDICEMTEEKLQNFSDVIADFMGKLLSTLFNMEQHHKSVLQNSMININNILTRADKVSKQINESVLNSRLSLPSDLKDQIIENLSVINETTDYARLTGQNSNINECDFKVKNLVEKISCKDVRLDDSVPETIFGDMDSIAISVSRIVASLEESNPSGDIRILMKHEKVYMGYSLNIKIMINNISLTEADIIQLRALSMKMDKSGELLKTYEQRIFSAFRLIQKMNGSVRVDKAGDKFLSVNLSIPTLMADAE